MKMLIKPKFPPEESWEVIQHTVSHYLALVLKKQQPMMTFRAVYGAPVLMRFVISKN